MARGESLLNGRVKTITLISLDELMATGDAVLAKELSTALRHGALPHYVAGSADGARRETFVVAVDARSFCARNKLTSDGHLERALVSFPDYEVARWTYHPSSQQSIPTETAPSSPFIPSRFDADFLSVITRGVGALERIAGALERLVPASPSPTPVPLRDSMNSLVTAVRQYWEQTGYVADKKIRVRGAESDTYQDFHDPLSIDDAARSIDMTSHWTLGRLTAGNAAEQDLFEWQRRAHKGRTSVAAQTILYLALTKSIISSRMLVAHVAAYVFHAPLVDVRTAGDLVGLRGTNRGDSYSTVLLRERLVLPVVQCTIDQYKKR
ncbi:MAG: hypothetical protein Q7R76_05765 [Candidatus Woesearchaeota archaeon]|nr:hypothetical protein [Candidatus Woesearchaeota archaeon]